MRNFPLLTLLFTTLCFGQNAEEYRIQANEFVKQKNFLDARIAFSISKKLNPYNWQLYKDMGWMHYKNKNYKDAIVEFESGKKLAPQHDDFYINLGNCYLELGDNNQAINNFTKWLEFNTGNNGNLIGYKKFGAMMVFMQRGKAYLYSGKKKLACDDWYKAKKLSLSDVNELIDEYCK